jgi:hypothetical protein
MGERFEVFSARVAKSETLKSVSDCFSLLIVPQVRVRSLHANLGLALARGLYVSATPS